MEILNSRKELKKCDCWDTTKVIKNEEEYEHLKKLVKEKNQEIMAMKGHILDNAESLHNFLKVSEEESRALDRLIIYTRLSFDEDTTDNKNKAKMLEIRALSALIQDNESFIPSEFMKKDLEDVMKYIEENEELKIYTRYFAEIYKDKERILSEEEERIITKATNAFGTPDSAFTSLDESDIYFDKILVDGEEVELTPYNYSVFLEHPDQNVRKNTFQTFYKYYKNHKNTFASLLKGNYDELEFIRDIRKYDSALEMALDEIHVPVIVYDNLVKNVHKYMDLNVNYQKLKAKLLNNQEYHLYDTYVPVIEPPKQKFTKEEAIDIVTKALSPLGDDYLKHFKQVFDNQTVDFYPNKGKHTGAYQWGCYDSPSYVLLNFNGNIDSVSTLAHELGHAVHSMYSKENNPYHYAGYEIFLAEIASTVNEMFLSNYLLNQTNNREEKIYYLCEFLDKVKATIYRQTMFAEFERIMSEKRQNKESLTENLFSDTYYKLNEEYFKDSVIIDDEIRYEEYRVSHFYRPFYVYQYATGLICAICIVNDILSDEKNVSSYIDFLSSGSSLDCLDILKKVNIDLTENAPFEKAFKFIESRFNELEELDKDVNNE